jgi:hypothetical protein
VRSADLDSLVDPRRSSGLIFALEEVAAGRKAFNFVEGGAAAERESVSFSLPESVFGL